ncbi:hypothetical protein Droror1_Dr00016003 [Drosera rotundifolia]
MFSKSVFLYLLCPICTTELTLIYISVGFYQETNVTSTVQLRAFTLSRPIVWFIHVPFIAIEESRHERFTIDLVHRDSPLSPLRNPSKTKYACLADSIRRSTARVHHFRQASASDTMVESVIVPAGGEYLMNLLIGTPPIPFLGIVDTGSDLTWTQCQPCEQCYRQSLPIFNPKRSSSFKRLSCESNACDSLESRGACTELGVCSYDYSYGDRSYTNGELATETLTFAPFNSATTTSTASPRSTSIRGVVVGCGHSNGGTFNDKGSGLIGLGGGALSLTSQIGAHIGGKFSYCLVPFNQDNSTSKMSFGPDPLLTGPGVVSTPLVKKYPDTFYYLTLEGISVGNNTFTYNGSSSSNGDQEGGDGGNIIIDSGTTLTLLPQELYDQVEAELGRVITAERAQDPDNVLQLCHQSKGDIDTPTVTVHFSGADVELKQVNSFVKVQDNIVCFSMIPASDIAIYGNLAQMDMLVGYDLEAGKVSFLPTDCSKYL